MDQKYNLRKPHGHTISNKEQTCYFLSFFPFNIAMLGFPLIYQKAALNDSWVSRDTGFVARLVWLNPEALCLCCRGQRSSPAWRVEVP